MKITTHFQMDRAVLEKVCPGILENTIANTPGEGLIEIVADSFRMILVYVPVESHCALVLATKLTTCPPEEAN